MSAHQEPHIILPTQPHTHTAIILHGRGSNGPEFASDLFESRVRSTTGALITVPERFPSWKFVFPSSLSRHSTVFQEEMSQWFDIYSLQDPSAETSSQIEGLREGISYLRELIDVEDLPLKKIVLGGISQGSAVGIHALMGGVGRRMGGFFGLSTWMPFASAVKRRATAVADIETSLKMFYRITLGVDEARTHTESPDDVPKMSTTPIFLSHSADDATVDVSLGREMRDILTALGFKVTWKEYEDGGHWIQEPQGINVLAAFLASIQ